MKKSNNMRLLLLTIIFLFLKTGIGFSQSQNVKPYSEVTAIYKISNDEAKQLILSSDKDIDDRYFHTFVDTFSTQYYKNDLSGYFLFVKAVQEHLEVTLESYVFMEVISLNNKRDFAIQVIDTLGNTIENANVLLGKKKIPFDQKTKTYRKRKKYKGGFLSVTVNEETLFLKAKEQDRRSIFSKRYRRFKTSKVGKFLIPPYFYSKNKRPRGYIALNKPKFLPGDTVKVKAYFTNHKGKPFKKKLQLFLTDGSRYERKTYFNVDLPPTTPGAYLHEFVLSDSLTLDENYLLTFYSTKRKKKKKQVMAHSFYYEDYQLDEVDYFLRREKDEYFKGDPIIIFAEGKDKNNWTIPDGKVRLVATRGEVEEFYEKKVLIPDTLWEHSQDLATRGETQIIFPTGNLPNAKFTIDIEAEFFNSNGEMQTESIEFDYDGNEEKIEVKIENGFIIAECFANGKTVEREAELWMGNEEWVDVEKKVQLPFKTPINPFYSFYYFETEKAEAEFEYDEYNYRRNEIRDKKYQHNIIDFTYRTQDSVFATILNPNGVPLNIQLRTKNNTITETYSTDKKWTTQLAIPKGKPCFLSYQFVWLSQPFEIEKTIFFEKKLLDIQTNLPPAVQPGEQVQVRVIVKDKKERPRKNVNLTAGAINAQFEDITNVREPSLTYKTPRRPKKYNSFNLKTYDKKKYRKSITTKWDEQLEFSKSLFYRLRFPQEGVLMEYDTVAKDSFYHNIPQFAPYLVKEGKVQPIYMIYCNRQLVYYYDVDDNPPYSFVGQAGYNRIVIRGRDSTYTVDSVFLKAGHKLELSIDLEHYRKSDFRKNIKVSKATRELTKQEKALLRNKIFILRKFNFNQKNYVWQDLWNIHKLPIGRRNKGRPFKIGPMFQAPIRFLERDGWSNLFRFEPHFVYDIENNRERLYESPYFKTKSKIVLPKSLPVQKVGAIIYSPKEIEVESSFLEKVNLRFENSYRSYGNRKGSTYEFEIKEGKENDFKKFAIVLLEDDTTFTIYDANTTELYNLKPKTYTLIVFSPTGNYIKKEFSIPPNALMYEDLTEIPFTVDSSQILFREIFTKHLAKIKVEDKKNPSPTFQRFSQNNTYYGTSGIEGKITDEESGEELIGANIVVKENGNFIQGASTDIDGNFSINIPEGTYDVEVSYTGYPTQKVEEVFVNNFFTKMDVQMKTDPNLVLQEVVVTGYSVPLIRQDETVMGQTITSSQIRNLPTRSIRGLASTTAGVSSSDEGAAISIKGLRGNATDYYIDGVRISGETDLANPRYFMDNYDGDESNDILLDDIQLRSKFADYAYFKPNLITDQNGEAYFTVTFPDNITAWKTFVIGMDNKLNAGTQISETRAFKKLTAQLSLPRFLIEGDETNIIGKSINFTQDSFNITTAFKLGGEILKTNEAEIKDALIETTNISTPENMDSLTLSYLLAMENYDDGEERKIPVFQKGVEENNGVFKVLNESDTFEKTFDSDKGEVQIRIEDNILEVLLEDLDFLKQYPYKCNEQTASRLIALLLEKDLKQLLGQKFKDEKKIRKAIRRLERTQNDDGSWGWWAKGKYNAWMTSYVLNALHQAKIAKYKTKALDKGLIFLTNQIPALDDRSLLNSLLLFSDIEQNMDYKKFLTHLDTTLTSKYDKFALTKIRQAQGLPYSIDSILQYKNEDVFGGWSFGEENYRWYNNSFQLTLLAHDIFQGEKDTAAVKNIQQYFLGKKTRRGWRNTFETAKILLAILPDLMKEKNGLEKNRIQLTGAMNEKISKFPFEAKFRSGQPLQVQKSGSSPIFFTAYQSFWNKKPKEKDDIFSIKTTLKQEDKTTQNLKAAVATDLIVEVEVKKSADYVMIEIPIPAGCSYRSKPQTYRNHESHREYFKNKTAIFCEALPVGKYTFTIPLEPRFSGRYTLNPTKVEQMYFPVFYGRNEMEKVSIEE